MPKDEITALEQFIISAQAEGSTDVVYFSIDASSGGYPWWSSQESSAYKFKTEKEAFDQVSAFDKLEPSKQSDGKVYIHSDIRSLFPAVDGKNAGRVTFEVSQILLKATYRLSIAREDKFPTGYKYD